jgi:hypothetical protein
LTQGFLYELDKVSGRAEKHYNANDEQIIDPVEKCIMLIILKLICIFIFESLSAPTASEGEREVHQKTGVPSQ